MGRIRRESLLAFLIKLQVCQAGWQEKHCDAATGERELTFDNPKVLPSWHKRQIVPSCTARARLRATRPDLLFIYGNRGY